MRKNTVFCLIAALLFLVSAVGTTFAAATIVGESVPAISTGTIKGQIVEVYETASGVYPGNTVGKTVNVKNTGDSDSIVRIKVEKVWGEVRDDDGKLIPKDGLSTDNILIDYNTEYWRYNETDGYFYYLGVLKPGETTLEPLFEEFKIDEDTGNEYAGLQGDIIIKMECVQAGSDGASLWGTTLTDLGIEYVETEPVDTTTEVTLQDGGFVFNPETTDLFSDFKNLLPGETRNQTVKVENSTEDIYAIGVRAELIDQLGDDPATLELIDRLLKEYAQIVITDENGHKLYEGPVWGNLGVDPFEFHGKTMEHNIGLGNFHPGDSKDLSVQLMLDPAIGNEYQELLGLIKWVWTATEIEVNNETVILQGTKTWFHGGVAEADRPTEITINIKNGDTIVKTEKVTAEDHWKWAFELPKFQGQTEIQYTIEEVPVEGYEVAQDGYNITNTHESHEDLEIKGKKTWDHGSNKGEKPQYILVSVLNGSETVASKRVTAENDWSWSFTLPKHSKDGSVAEYKITEEAVKGYKLEKTEGYNLFNKFIEPDEPDPSSPPPATTTSNKAPSVNPPTAQPIPAPAAQPNYSTTNYVAPRTGDAMNLVLWGGLMMLSAAMFTIFFVAGRKEKEEES